ncbi:hypothetical protein K439DRAFT_1340225 [Ramaria rubella]|nr:hypothetical protein K439DRAFT_1340225 [Ramaria rubella]
MPTNNVYRSKHKYTPFSYILIRLLFKFVLKVFYGTIVVENEEYLPKKGESCIFCANHTNSLTDALSDYLRMTAKATQFGKGTFSSWLIESSGALPLKRRMDYNDPSEIDNSDVMNTLYEALEEGYAVCLFPEGMSRYRPALSPLKTGVARIISEVLTRRQNDPDFEITLLTCSITYMHRQHFRSDVLITFNPPVTFRPQECPTLLAPVDFRAIRSLTDFMADQISAGTLDAPSWDVISTAKTAARIYAPLGTNMTLGDHVRVVRAFVEGFKKTGKGWNQSRERTKMQPDETRKRDEVVDLLTMDLKDYHSELLRLGIKDDRIRVGPLARRVLIARVAARAFWLAVLFIISLPGLALWTPVFATTRWSVKRLKKTGPPEDVWDEIAQHKLLVGLLSGTCVWLSCVLLTLPFAAITVFFVPCLMWMSLRFLEDAVSAFRALTALTSLLYIGKETLLQLSLRRQELHDRIMTLAVDTLELPSDPENYFRDRGGREKGRVRGGWESNTSYFSIKRRRKRDWNEILRIWPHDG